MRLGLPVAEVEGAKQRLSLYQQGQAYFMPAVDRAAAVWSALRFQTFQTVWRTVNEAYFDPAFGGVDWTAVGEKYRGRLPAASDNAHLRELLEAMVGELGRSHFAVIPRDSAVFNPSERTRIGNAGTKCALIDNGAVLTEVKPDSVSARAGLHAGDVVLKVNGVALAPIAASLAQAGFSAARRGLYLTEFVESSLSEAAGTKVELEIATPAGEHRTLSVTCEATGGEWSEPMGNFPSRPIQCEAVRGADGIAYLRFNIFVPQVMKDIRKLLRSLQPGDGLIIDLRGNPGGVSLMASGISGLLCREKISLGTMHLREGLMTFVVHPQLHIFDGPVAILIDGQSASTSEIMAAGLQEAHRARIFGEPSAGAALPSSFKKLPTDDLFQYAIADVTTTRGILLEGKGVQPDQVVLRSRAEIAAGDDAVAAAARTWLDGERQKHGVVALAIPGAP